MKKTYWIWYPADFELYHAMKQNFSRIERGIKWPAFWKSEGFRNRVVFRRTYSLEKETSFTVCSYSDGYVLAGDKKYPFGTRITCGPGETRISVHAACIEKFPSIYIEGDVICSDIGWMAEDYDKPPVPAGYSRYFTMRSQDPSVWEYTEQICEPVRIEEREGGVLYEFESELTAQIEISAPPAAGSDTGSAISIQQGQGSAPLPLTVYCGESEAEALDMVHCYYSWQPDPCTGRCPRCAVRFAYIPGVRACDIRVRAVHQYVDIPVRASFHCDDPLLNEIWKAAERTFTLCSGIFFIDGIKRDKWIWSGDAYQSLFVNQYLMADADINRRTLLALRGNEHMTTHINTIVDYTLFWLLGVRAHYEAYGDLAFVRRVWDKMTSLMEFCAGQTDENGFLIGREGDWIFIDWADLDKEGPLCAEQMLYAQCLDTMSMMSRQCGFPEKAETYRAQYDSLCEKINEYYWDEEKHAYIDSFVSGRRHVMRHANIFAVLYGIAGEDRQREIAEHVLRNSEVPRITTPYFKFYELDALCRLGYYGDVLSEIRSYWGGMLRAGAVTFWEEYDPAAPEEEQYDMYGDRFGKSLCHAWGASPIYLLARYFTGLHITDIADGKYETDPQLSFFKELECTLPVGEKQVTVSWKDGKLDVREEKWNTEQEKKQQEER